MKLTIEITGSFSKIKEVMCSSSEETPEEFIKELFDAANKDTPIILLNEPLSFARANSDLAVKLTIKDEEI